MKVSLSRVQHVLTALLVLACIYMMWFARDFLVPVVMAFLIAITFRPAIRRLSNRGIAAWMSASMFAFFMLCFGLAAAYMVSGPLASWIADAPRLQQDFFMKLQSLLVPLKRLVEVTQTIREAAAPVVEADAQKVVVAEPAIPALLWFATIPATYILMLGGAIILSLFLMASGNLLYEKLINVMPTLTDKKNALRLAYEVEREVSGYLLTLTAINAGVGAVVGVLFYALGMPSAHLWALVAFFFNFIPYAGPLAGTALAAVTAIVTFDSLQYALLAPAAYTMVVTIENQFVSPYVFSRRLEINSVAILIAFAFFAWLWGILGIVVAVPLLVTLRVFTLHFESLYVLGEFLSQTSTPRQAREEPVVDAAKPGTAAKA